MSLIVVMKFPDQFARKIAAIRSNSVTVAKALHAYLLYLKFFEFYASGKHEVLYMSIVHPIHVKKFLQNYRLLAITLQSLSGTNGAGPVILNY